MSGETLETRNSNSSSDTNTSVVVSGQPPPDADASAATETGEATTTNGDNGINSTSDSSMAKGLSSIITSIIRDFDSQAEQTARSQDQLNFALDRLTGELDQLLEDAPLAFIMQQATKISGVKKRVSSLNLVLKSIQKRVDNIDRLISASLPHDKITSGTAGQL